MDAGDAVATLPDRPQRAADLKPEALANLFGIPDLPDRLAAVDACITDTLGRDDALLGPAAVRVASSGSKRLRPLFTIVTAAAGKVFNDRVVAAAAATELVHVATLVHDDILDGADTRRGKPTINAVEGVSHAVLAGDYILARAAELAAEVSQDASRLFAAVLADLCEGQVLEMRDAFNTDRSIDAYHTSIRGKTAALFESACRLGAHCAGLGEANTRALGRYGHAFGMGFQLVDDVLDLIGDVERLGKPTGNDIVSGVYTFPVLTALGGDGGAELRHALERSGALAVDVAAVGDGEVARALELVRASGAIAQTLAEAERWSGAARRAVDHLNQTTVGEGLGLFPRTFTTWMLENLIDRRYLQLPTSATV